MSLKNFSSGLKAWGLRLVSAPGGPEIFLKKSASLGECLPGASTNELTHAALDPVAKIPEYKIVQCG